MDQSDVVIYNSDFYKNYAQNDAGSILIKKLSPSYKKDTNVTIDECEFFYSFAHLEGGVIRTDDKYLNLKIITSLLRENSAGS